LKFYFFHQLNFVRHPAEIDFDFLKRLREKGWSLDRLAARFGVSKSTIQRRLRTNEPDREVLDFARRLQKLLAEVPNEYCRKELQRTIHHMRRCQAISEDQKHEKILHSLATGAREVEEIAEDCGFSKRQTGDLLEQLIESGAVERRVRGGTLNRGRKMKFHYFPGKL
jgi:predicted transcriptional regulator